MSTAWNDSTVPPEGEVILDIYENPGYDGEWAHIVRTKDGGYLINAGSHCSCNGPDDDGVGWEPATDDEVQDLLEELKASSYRFEESKKEIAEAYRKVAIYGGFEKTEI